MGHAIVLAFLGIAGLLLPKKTKQKLINEEAKQWLQEQQEN